MKWNGSTTIITGASRGIGRAVAIEAAKRGARVGLLARSKDDLAKVGIKMQINEMPGAAFQERTSKREFPIFFRKAEDGEFQSIAIDNNYWVVDESAFNFIAVDGYNNQNAWSLVVEE